MEEVKHFRPRLANSPKNEAADITPRAQSPGLRYHRATAISSLANRKVEMLRSAWILFVLLSPFAMLFAQETPVALTGTLVTPDGIVQDGVVLIQNGRITAAGAKLTLPPGTKTVETHGVIAPGLIDLHNHLTWNVFPRWKPNQLFGNRYDWQQIPIYKLLMDAPHKALVQEGLECQMERYAEVKAITEGETSVVGGTYSACDQGLARNLDYDPELDTGLGTILYNIFPLEMSEKELAAANTALSAIPRGSLLAHLAEGSPKDASAAEEFYVLGGRGLLKPGVALIHATALTPQNFSAMAKAGVGFSWSPRSNIELYGDTTNVAAAKAAGLLMALAPDWSPTGSDGLLGELNYASVWNQSQPAAIFTDRELVSMSTANPAQLVGLQDQIGSLAPNHAADLLVIRNSNPPKGKDSYWTLTHTASENVALVVIGGQATYGDPQLMHQLSNGPTETLHICGTEKLISFASEKQPRGTFAATEAALDQALQQQGRRLASLAECGQ
jgi:5-methylthioadenosine/S-adenosylhomocysteine deaminase